MTTTIERWLRSARITAGLVLANVALTSCARAPGDVEWPEPPPPTMARPIGVEVAAPPPASPPPPPSTEDDTPPGDAAPRDADEPSTAPVLPPEQVSDDAGTVDEGDAP